MNSAGDAKFSFFDFRWSKLLFTVFFSSSFYLYVRLYCVLVVHLFSARYYSFSIRCNFILHDNEENCLGNVRSWFTSSLDYNSRWWFFFYKSYFLSVRFAVFFFMSKFPSTYIEIQKPLFNFIQVFCISSAIISIHLLMLSIHHAYFIFCCHPSKYELFIKKNHLMKR